MRSFSSFANKWSRPAAGESRRKFTYGFYPGQTHGISGAVCISNHTSRLVLGIGLLLVGLLLAGCSRSRSEPAPPTDEPPVTVAEGEIPAAPMAPASFAHVNPDAAVPNVTPTRLAIPDIDLDTPVVELGWTTQEDAAGNIFSAWNVAEYAAGWHVNSSLPDEGGNVVMSGHNNVAGAVFRELDQLKRGNEIFVYANNMRYSYLVDKVLIVPDRLATPEQRRENAKWIGEYDDDRLTLVSCWPRDDNSHRIIVVAHHQESAPVSIAQP